MKTAFGSSRDRFARAALRLYVGPRLAVLIALVVAFLLAVFLVFVQLARAWATQFGA